MPLRARTAVLLVALLALALPLGAAIVTRGATGHPAAPAAAPPPAVSSQTIASPRRYLAEAEAAYARTRAWWDPRRHWYRQFLPGHGDSRLATPWGSVHLFGATNALAIADPTRAHVAAARRFADGAQRYWNPTLRPVPGYGLAPGKRGTRRMAWYDDDAWWGVAFYDAFRATHDKRFLRDADRALAFVNSGWDPVNGGIYWSIDRTFKSSESLAGGTLIAASLYEQTHAPRYLALAKKYIRWANAHVRGADGLYGNRSTPANPMPYIEGAMAEAFVRLCHATGTRSWCRQGEAVLRATSARFPVLSMGPQYDSIYIRSLLEVYRFDRNPRWYRIAASTADRARANAAAPNGLFLRKWDGQSIGVAGARPDRLQTHAATTSVLAWVAAANAPGMR